MLGRCMVCGWTDNFVSSLFSYFTTTSQLSGVILYKAQCKACNVLGARSEEFPGVVQTVH